MSQIQQLVPLKNLENTISCECISKAACGNFFLQIQQLSH
jgi:hypothetical protein